MPKIAVMTPETAQAEATAPEHGGVARWQDFFQLLKPRVMSLVVFTGLTGLVCAETPLHPFLAAVAILCIAVGAGASAALNMWFDSDIDAVMSRTRTRPIPAGRVPREEALMLGLTLSVLSVVTMQLAANTLAAARLADRWRKTLLHSRCPHWMPRRSRR